MHAGLAVHARKLTRSSLRRTPTAARTCAARVRIFGSVIANHGFGVRERQRLEFINQRVKLRVFAGGQRAGIPFEQEFCESLGFAPRHSLCRARWLGR